MTAIIDRPYPPPLLTAVSKTSQRRKLKIERAVVFCLGVFIIIICLIHFNNIFGFLCKNRTAHCAESVRTELNHSNSSINAGFVRADRFIFVEDETDYGNHTYQLSKCGKNETKAFVNWLRSLNRKNKTRGKKYIIPEEAHMKEYVAPYNDFEFATCDCMEDDEVPALKVITRCVRTKAPPCKTTSKCRPTTTATCQTTTSICLTTTFICTTSTCRCVSPDPCKSTSRKCKKKYCTITTECPPRPTKYDCVPEGPWSFPTQSFVVTVICEKCASTKGVEKKNFPPWWSCKTKCTKTTLCDEYETTTCECETTTTCTTSTCRFLTICIKETTTGCPTTTCLTWTTTCPTVTTTTTCTTVTCPPITTTPTTCGTTTCRTTTCGTTTCRATTCGSCKRWGMKKKLKYFPDKDLEIIDIDDD